VTSCSKLRNRELTAICSYYGAAALRGELYPEALEVLEPRVTGSNPARIYEFRIDFMVFVVF
jgi:hypothetical protein